MEIFKCGCGNRRKKKGGCKGPNCPKPETQAPEPAQSAQESQQAQ